MKIKTKQFIEAYDKSNGKLEDIKKIIKQDYDVKVTVQAISHRIGNLRRTGMIELPSGNKVAIGQILSGVSTRYKDDGTVGTEWVKTNVAAEAQLNAMNLAIEELQKRVIPTLPKTYNGINDDDILVKIPIADAHIGLLTWHKEVGQDFDLTIAKDLYTDAVGRLISTSPSASTCLLLDLGDTIHTDDQSNQTKASKHQLDVDGRFDKQFDMVIHILTTMIDLALEKYKTVIFRKTRGNHDPDSSVAIGALLDAYYRNEPRVKIERSPSLFWHMKFGKTLHFSTHGHTTRKQSVLPEIVAHDCRDIWSECTAGVYIDTGHVHHQQILETRTATCESHNSLAVGDQFNFGHGYRSLRNMKLIAYHKDYGEIARNTVSYKMISNP